MVFYTTWLAGSFVLAIAMCLFHHECTGTPDECRDGWEIFTKSTDDNSSRFICYRFFNDSVRWRTADTKCRQDNSELLTITGEKIQGFIHDNITNGKLSWIGLRLKNDVKARDAEKNSDWSWANCASDVYRNWYQGDESTQGQKCVNMRSDGKWNSASCAEGNQFVCQYFPDEEMEMESVLQHIRSLSVAKKLNLTQRTCFRKAVRKAKDLTMEANFFKDMRMKSLPPQDLIIYSETYKWLQAHSANNTRNISDSKNDIIRWILKDYDINGTNRFSTLWMKFNQSILETRGAYDPVTVLFISQSNFNISFKPPVYFAEGNSDNYTEFMISNWFILDNNDIMNITLSLEFTAEIQIRPIYDYEAKEISCTDLNDKRRCLEFCDCTSTDESDKSSFSCSCNNTQYGIEVFVTYMLYYNKYVIMITSIGQAASCGMLLLTLIIYCALRSNLPSSRFVIHFHIMLATLMSSVAFLVNGRRWQLAFPPFACNTLGILRQYFSTAVFTWMLLEGVNLHRRIVSFTEGKQIQTRADIFIGWGVPVITMIAPAVLVWTTDVMKNICWITYRNDFGIAIAFMGPIVIIGLANLIVLIYVQKELRTVMNEKGETSTMKHIRTGLHRSLLLLTLLGLPWLFQLILWILKEMMVEYILVTSSSLQGVFVAFIYCFLNTEVTTALCSCIKYRPTAHREKGKAKRNDDVKLTKWKDTNKTNDCE